jgi:hypothetical protein
MSNAPHVTICLYDSASKHVGGVHAPETAEEAATFKGGMEKLLYHGEKKVEANFICSIDISC